MTRTTRPVVVVIEITGRSMSGYSRHRQPLQRHEPKITSSMLMTVRRRGGGRTARRCAWRRRLSSRWRAFLEPAYRAHVLRAFDETTRIVSSASLDDLDVAGPALAGLHRVPSMTSLRTTKT